MTYEEFKQDTLYKVQDGYKQGNTEVKKGFIEYVRVLAKNCGFNKQQTDYLLVRVHNGGKR